MAQVKNLQLKVTPVDHSRKKVSVSYEIEFESNEWKSECSFVEDVSLRRKDGSFYPDDHLWTVHMSCIKASRASINKHFEMIVSLDKVAQDDETVVLGEFIEEAIDQIYAEVLLTAYLPETMLDDEPTPAHFPEQILIDYIPYNVPAIPYSQLN